MRRKVKKITVFSETVIEFRLACYSNGFVLCSDVRSALPRRQLLFRTKRGAFGLPGGKLLSCKLYGSIGVC